MANTDKFIKGVRKLSGNLDSSGIINDTIDNFGLQNSSGLVDGKTYEITIDRVDANGKKTPEKEEVICGVVSSGRIINAVRGVEGTARAHGAGAVWEIRMTASQWGKAMDGILVEHGQDGLHLPAALSRPIHAATDKVTPVDADEFGIWNSVGGVLAKLSLANLKAALKTYFLNDSQIMEFGMARQAIMNGNFDIWQRGTIVALTDLTATFQADRWFDVPSKDGGTLPSLTRSRQLLTSGDIPNAFYYTKLSTTGAGTSLGVNSSHKLVQRIENGTRNLCGAGKKVTVSFWAKSSIANKRICPALYQNYGTGGSPTADEKILGTPITLTSSWVKYIATFTTNTLVGKTFGTNADDYLQLNIWHMWGTTIGNTDVSASVTAETYVGAGAIDIAQVQLCAGDVALPFQPKSYEEELRACQRYYEKSYDIGTAPGTNNGYGAYGNGIFPSNSTVIAHVKYKVMKRIAVTPVTYSIAGTSGRINATAGEVIPTVSDIGSGGFSARYGATTEIYFHWTADAEL